MPPRQPFQPDFLFSKVIDVHFGGNWLVLRGTVSSVIGRDPGPPQPQVYRVDYTGWNPSPAGVANIFMVDGNGSGSGTAPVTNEAPTAEQQQQMLLVYQPTANPFSAGTDGANDAIAFLNLDLLTSRYPYPTLQVDYELSYDDITHDPDLTSDSVNPTIYENPIARKRTGNAGAQRLSVSGKALASAFDSSSLIFTGTTLLYKVRIFVDLSAKARGWVNALTVQRLTP